MTPKHWLLAAATAAPLAGILLAGVVISSSWARADGQDGENSRVKIGFEIAPVKLNLAGKDRELVGFGSYKLVQIIRNGTDFDHIHPTCTGVPNGKCLPPPFDGDLL